MDIVYLVKRQSDYTELYYSLRSIANIPHGKVYICGPFVPRFIRNVVHIPAFDNHTYRSENVFHKMLKICTTPEVSEDFILMNDDFYITRKAKTIPYLYKGTIAQHLKARYNSRLATMPLTAIIEKDFELNDKDFEMHSPFIVNKKKFLNMCKKYNITTMHLWRSLYCKHYNIEGEFAKDRKVKNKKQIKTIKQTRPTFVSSRNEIVKDSRRSELMHKILPKSRYVR